jgi:hypothetical protein
MDIVVPTSWLEVPLKSIAIDSYYQDGNNDMDNGSDSASTNTVVECIPLHAARSAIHRTLGVSPGGLVLHREMLLDIPLLIDFEIICNRRQVYHR